VLLERFEQTDLAISQPIASLAGFAAYRLLFAGGNGERQANSTGTHPANLNSGNTKHQGEGGNIFGNHRSGTDHAMLAQGIAADDGGIGTDGRTSFDQRRNPKLSSALGKQRPRGKVIGKNAGGTAKNPLLQSYPTVDGDVVLELAVVADKDITADEAVLPNAAPLAKSGTAGNMAEVPHLRTIANNYIGIDNTGRMNEVV